MTKRKPITIDQAAAEPQKPRRRPPNAGKGRRKGVENRLTKDVRQAIVHFLERNWESAQEDYEKLRKVSPARALNLLAKLSEFAAPKLSAIAHAQISRKLVLEDLSSVELEQLLAGRSVEQLEQQSAAPALPPPEPEPPLEPVLPLDQPQPIEVAPLTPAVADAPEPERPPAADEAPFAQPAPGRLGRGSTHERADRAGSCRCRA